MSDAPYALVSLIDNDSRLYRMRQHADKQLALKKARGVYDSKRAQSAYTGLVELIAKDAEKAHAEYEERQPRPWHVAWTRGERDAVERELVARFENAWKSPKSEEHKELLKSLPAKYRGGAFGKSLSEADVRARRRHGYTLAELRGISAISQGHGENLMVDTGLTRVWLSRMTKADGAKYDNAVIVETRPAVPSGSGPLWKKLIEYQPKGGARSTRASASRHESGNNPRTKSKARGKKHPLDAAAVRRIERAAAKSVPSRKRAPFTSAQRKQRGLAPLGAGLKARVDVLVGRSKK